MFTFSTSSRRIPSHLASIVLGLKASNAPAEVSLKQGHFHGGEGGIRTHDTFRYTRSPGARTRPDYATSPGYTSGAALRRSHYKGSPSIEARFDPSLFDRSFKAPGLPFSRTRMARMSSSGLQFTRAISWKELMVHFWGKLFDMFR